MAAQLEPIGAQRKGRMTANFQCLGAGYYDHDDPYDARFDFFEFKGDVVHPQFWPENLDYTGKKVVVIGSGATAVTSIQHITTMVRLELCPHLGLFC